MKTGNFMLDLPHYVYIPNIYELCFLVLAISIVATLIVTTMEAWNKQRERDRAFGITWIQRERRALEEFKRGLVSAYRLCVLRRNKIHDVAFPPPELAFGR